MTVRNDFILLPRLESALWPFFFLFSPLVGLAALVSGDMNALGKM
jgi:hypothetical protein